MESEHNILSKPATKLYYTCSKVIYIMRYLLERLPLKLVLSLSFFLQRERERELSRLVLLPGNSNHSLPLSLSLFLSHTLFVYNISEKSANNVYSPHPQTTCSPAPVPPSADVDTKANSSSKQTLIDPETERGSKAHIEVYKLGKPN